jgi:hypothetical protein
LWLFPDIPVTLEITADCLPIFQPLAPSSSAKTALVNRYNHADLRKALALPLFFTFFGPTIGGADEGTPLQITKLVNMGDS